MLIVAATNNYVYNSKAVLLKALIICIVVWCFFGLFS